MAKLRSAQSAEEFEVVCIGKFRDIRLSPKCAVVYWQVIEGNDDISVRRRTHLQRYFAEYCDQKVYRLGDQKFKREGKFPDGNGTNAAIHTFKAWQFRLYGLEMTVAGKRTFVGVEYDYKKQNKADQNLLKEAAKAIGRLAEYKE
jgi:hypothetical protein